MNTDFNIPEHYQLEDGTDTMVWLRKILDKQAFRGFLEGNIQKYLIRYKKKNGLDDLKKARDYLNRLIAEIEYILNETEFAATKPEDRKDEKMFIIPLPGLVTTDGRQQYLTHKDCNFFACRRKNNLRQTWKEEHLKFVPEVYRQFAVEFDDAWEREDVEICCMKQ